MEVKDMKATCKNITKYVNAQMDRTGIDNISIGLPKLNKNTLNALRDNFKDVNVNQPFGYVRFER